MTLNAMTPNKACPVVLRHGGVELQVLVFQHPLAGHQLVKGSIEEGESPDEAALRELAEESGVRSASVVRHLGVWSSGFEQQVWAFVECQPASPLPDSWTHKTTDDGGHWFRFYWHNLSAPLAAEVCHPLFQNALAFIRTKV